MPRARPRAASPPGDRKIYGSGSLKPDEEEDHFSLKVRRKNGDTKGKIQYKDDQIVNFRSTQITSVTWDDVTKRALIEGDGVNKYPSEHQLHFVACADDNGDNGHADFLELHLSDGVNRAGTLSEGHIKYTSEVRDDD